MKRDLELIRKMVLAIEDGRSPNAIEGYSTEQIGYHGFLIIDSGLGNGVDSTTRDEARKGLKTAVIKNLTWEGHEFASESRDGTIWGKVMRAASSLNSVPLPVIRALLIAYMKESLGIR